MNAAAMPDGDGTRLAVQAAPRASRSEVVGLHGDAVRIRLKAPPVDGKANRALLEFLADAMGVPIRSLTLLAGEAGRRKFVHIAGVPPAEVLRRLGVELGL
jgi:hypothetical protein